MKTLEQISIEVKSIAESFSSIPTKPYFTILQPRRNLKEVPAQQLAEWNNRMIDMTSSAVSYHAIDGNPVDVARNYLMEKAIEDNPKFILWVDEDTVLPFYALPRMWAVAKEYPAAMVSGVYYIKFGGPMVSVIDDVGRMVTADAAPGSGLIRGVELTGMGCMLMSTDIVKGIKEKFPDIPLFCSVRSGLWDNPNIKDMGEDTWFLNLAHRSGYEVIVDTSVQCLHMELATGKYTAHPGVNLSDYWTNIPIASPLQLEDRPRVSKDYERRRCFINQVEQGGFES